LLIPYDEMLERLLLGFDFERGRKMFEKTDFSRSIIKHISPKE